jgi:hypothetical protein
MSRLFLKVKTNRPWWKVVAFSLVAMESLKFTERQIYKPEGNGKNDTKQKLEGLSWLH